MGLSNFRQTWKRDSAWGRSVPEVPDDHCELPRNTIATRFDGNHGAWMAPLGLTALVLCVLATISTPLFPPITVIEMVIKPDYPGGSGTSQKVQIGLWGLCWDGEDGDCSKFRGVFSGFGRATASLPERLSPLASTLTEIPQALLNGVGVFPILANAYIYVGAIYAAWSCTFFQQKLRRTAKWQYAAIACYHWVIIWLSISFGLMIGFCQKVKDNLALSDMKDFVDCKLGIAVWLMLTSLILMVCSAIMWHTWRLSLKRGRWQPAAWMMYIGHPDDFERNTGEEPTDTVGDSVQTSKDVEAQSEKRNAFSDNLSDCGGDSTLPIYSVDLSCGEIAITAQSCDELASSSPADHEEPRFVPAASIGPNSSVSQEILVPLPQESHEIAADSAIASAQSPAPEPKATQTTT